jgi:hypothetical protein
LQDNYGRKDAACEKRVKEVFNELRIDELYKEYEANTYEKLNKLIDSIPESSQQFAVSGTVSLSLSKEILLLTFFPPQKAKVNYEPMMEPFPLTIPNLGSGQDKVTLKREVFRSFLNKIYKRTK